VYRAASEGLENEVRRGIWLIPVEGQKLLFADFEGDHSARLVKPEAYDVRGRLFQHHIPIDYIICYFGAFHGSVEGAAHCFWQARRSLLCSSTGIR